MKVPFKTLLGAIVIITFVQNAKFDHFKTLDLVYFQDHGMWTARFQPLKFDWHAEDQQLAFHEWKGQITLALRASSINRDIWFAMIIGYLGKEGFKRWNTLPIFTNKEAQKDLEKVFKAITDTLEVSTSYWNHIDKIYSDIKQGDNESTNQLDQRIKNLVERCSTQPRRNWYVERGFCFMRPNISK